MSLENLSPQVLRRVAHEISDLISSPPEGIKIIPNEDNLTEVTAIITGPQDTPYEGGEFKMKLKLSSDFPQVPPKGYFLTKIFHPNVAKNGEICVNTLKRDWKESLGIRHLLLTVKCLLIVPNPESSLNEEAGRLLLEKYDDYAKHARLMTSIHAKASKQSNDLPSTAKEPIASKQQPVAKPKSKAKAKTGARKKQGLKRL